MARHNIDITVTTNAKNVQEVNEELSRMKVVIGLLFAKLQPNERDAFIDDLNGFGLTEESKLYSNFNGKD